MVAQRVLVVIDDCGAGDALRLSPYVAAVRRAFAGARVVMIAGPGAAEVFRESSAVDAVVASRLYRRDLSRWTSRFWKVAELCRLVARSWPRYDVVIVFWWGSRMLALLARLLGRARRFGYGPPGSFSTALGEYDFDADEMSQNWMILKAAGLTDRPAPRPTLEVPRRAEEAGAGLLRGAGWDGRAPIVVLHPGSDWACQRWQPQRWSEVADWIGAESGALVVLTGSASEGDLVAEIRTRLSVPSVSLAGKTSVLELAAVMRTASLVVTVDSAAYVVACAQGAPVVVLAGASRPERLAGGSPATVVRRMTAARAIEIDEHRRRRFADGGCSEDSCPYPGLTELAVADVLAEVRPLLPAAAARAYG